MHKNRIKKVQEEIEELKINALLISDRINVQYLTGFRGSYGFLLIFSKDVYLFTDSRYYERCKKEISGVQVRLIKDDWLLKYKIKRLGFEACSVDYDTYRTWKRKFKRIKLTPTRLLVEKLRMIKKPEEVKDIQRAITITEKVLNKARKSLKVGITELSLAKKIEDWMREIPDTLPAFHPIVAFGSNTSMPHAGLSKKRLCSNNLVLIDLGTAFKGYSSDLTRTFLMGRITREFKKIYSIVLAAQKFAIENIAPGKTGAEIDAAARNYIKKQGYGKYFGHPVGHGIGSIVHEIPRIGPENKYLLKPGMVFTIEPGIYIPSWGGIRIEDMVLVTKKGCEVLTHSPKDLKTITINHKP